MRFMMALVVAAATMSASAGYAECGSDLIVDVRSVPLAAHERIVGIDMTIAHGSILGVQRIPGDWGIAVTPESGGEASLSGSLAHGAGAVDSAEELPMIIVRDQSCDGSEPIFEVKAAIHVTQDFASSRRIELQQKDLRVRRADGSAFEPGSASNASVGGSPSPAPR